MGSDTTEEMAQEMGSDTIITGILAPSWFGKRGDATLSSDEKKGSVRFFTLGIDPQFVGNITRLRLSVVPSSSPESTFDPSGLEGIRSFGSPR